MIPSRPVLTPFVAKSAGMQLPPFGLPAHCESPRQSHCPVHEPAAVHDEPVPDRQQTPPLQSSGPSQLKMSPPQSRGSTHAPARLSIAPMQQTLGAAHEQVETPGQPTECEAPLENDEFEHRLLVTGSLLHPMATANAAAKDAPAIFPAVIAGRHR